MAPGKILVPALGDEDIDLGTIRVSAKAHFDPPASNGVFLDLNDLLPSVFSLLLLSLSMALVCRVPLELVNLIIDESLFDSQPDLASCALVCRAFRPICQKHLFSTILIKPPVSIKGRDPKETPSPASRLVDVLEGAPHLASYARTLEVYLQRQDNASYEDSGTQYFAIIPSLLILLPLLTPHIQTFSLSGCGVRPGEGSSAYCACVDWLTFSPKLQSAFLEVSGGPNITQLRVGFIMHVPGSFIPSQHSRLKTVTSQSMIWNLESSDIVSPSNRPHRHPLLKRLNVLARYSPVLQNISDAVLNLQLVEGTQTMSISIQQGNSNTAANQNTQNITRLMARCAPTLEHLYVNVFEGASPDWKSIVPHYDLNISVLRRLRSLHRRYSLRICESGTMFPNPIPTLLGTLGTIMADNHLDIYLDVRIYLPDEDCSLEALRWAPVSAMLLTLTSCTLHIRIQTSHLSRLEDIADRFRDQLIDAGDRIRVHTFVPEGEQDRFHLY